MKFLNKSPLLVRLPRDLNRRAAPGRLLLGICSCQEERLYDPHVAELGRDMDGTHGLWPPEQKTAAGIGHLLLIHIQVPKVVGSQPRAYLNQCLLVHQLSLCKIGHRVEVKFLIVIWLLVLSYLAFWVCYNVSTSGLSVTLRRLFSNP